MDACVIQISVSSGREIIPPEIAPLCLISDIRVTEQITASVCTSFPQEISVIIEIEKMLNWAQPGPRLGREVSYPLCNLLGILLTNHHHPEEKYKFVNVTMPHSDDQHPYFIAKENRSYLYQSEKDLQLKMNICKALLLTYFSAIVFTAPVIINTNKTK